MKQLQDMIQKGKEEDSYRYMRRRGGGNDLVNEDGCIHIMQENDWRMTDLMSFLPKTSHGEKNNNIFLFAYTHYHEVVTSQRTKSEHEDLINNLKIVKTKKEKDTLLKQWKDDHPQLPVDEQGNYVNVQKKEKPVPIRYTRQLGRVDYQRLAGMQRRELADLDRIMTEFDNAHGADPKRSRKFKAMRTALQELRTAYRSMPELDPADQRINPGEKTGPEQKWELDQKLTNSYALLERKRQALKQATDSYLDIWHWKLHLSENNQKRVNAAKMLSGMVMDTPASGLFYKSSRALEESRNSVAASTNAYEQNHYLTNQIHSMMQLTLRDNVKALGPEDPRREAGLRVMKAQERLWNYSQSTLHTEKKPAKEKESGGRREHGKEKERVPLEELVQEENENKIAKVPEKENIDAKNEVKASVFADLNTIKAYAGEQAPDTLKNAIDRILSEDKLPEPKRIRWVLNELYLSGSKTLKERRMAKKENEKVFAKQP